MNVLLKYLLLSLLFFSSCQSAIESQRESIKLFDTSLTSLNKALDSSILDFQQLKDSLSQLVKIDYDTTLWTDIKFLEPSIITDMRYATSNNFVEEQMYDCGRCFLRPEVAKAIQSAHKKLQTQGLGLKMYDCFRPRPIQWKLWKKVPDPRYVSDPRKGSMHNRGAAVDLTVVDREGKELDMGTDFDFFGRRAYTTNMDLPQEILGNRKILQDVLIEVGFRTIRTEWWHFAFTKKRYELSDMLWECE